MRKITSLVFHLVGGIVLPPLSCVVVWFLIMGFFLGGVLDGVGGETERNYPFFEKIAGVGQNLLADLLKAINLNPGTAIITWVALGFAIGLVVFLKNEKRRRAKYIFIK